MNNIDKEQRLLSAMRIGLYHTEQAALRANWLAQVYERHGLQGTAHQYTKLEEESAQAAEFIQRAIDEASTWLTRQ